MRKSWTDNGWRKRFALFPIYLSDGPNKQMIWLEWAWVRDCCIYREVSLEKPDE